MDDVIKCYCGSSWRRAQRREETTSLSSDPIHGLTFCTLCLSFTPTISGVGRLGGFVVLRRRACGCGGPARHPAAVVSQSLIDLIGLLWLHRPVCSYSSHWSPIFNPFFLFLVSFYNHLFRLNRLASHRPVFLKLVFHGGFFM
jgi:hypothetical protein